jgi:predicted nucleotidyltransferase
VPEQPQVLRIGYFGSCARGDWGVGSDLDVVIIVRSSAQRFERRAIEFDLTGLLVPADLLVYTEEEWQRLWQQGKWRQAIGEMVWVYQRN